jgi:hypothetical protein
VSTIASLVDQPRTIFKDSAQPSSSKLPFGTRSCAMSRGAFLAAYIRSLPISESAVNNLHKTPLPLLALQGSPTQKNTAAARYLFLLLQPAFAQVNCVCRGFRRHHRRRGCFGSLALRHAISYTQANGQTFCLRKQKSFPARVKMQSFGLSGERLKKSARASESGMGTSSTTR